MNPRHHPCVALWITVAVVVVLVAYPLSFGPACWMAGELTPEKLFSDRPTYVRMLPYMYYPILRLEEATRGPTCVSPFAPAIEWYATLFRDDGSWPALDRGEGIWFCPPDPPPDEDQDDPS